MQVAFIHSVEDLIHKAPVGWMTSVSDALKSFPATATAEFVLQRLPTTNNADLAFLATDEVPQSLASMACAIDTEAGTP